MISSRRNIIYQNSTKSRSSSLNLSTPNSRLYSYSHTDLPDPRYHQPSGRSYISSQCFPAGTGLPQPRSTGSSTFLSVFLFFFLDPLVSYYSKNAYHGNTHSHFRRTRLFLAISGFLREQSASHSKEKRKYPLHDTSRQSPLFPRLYFADGTQPVWTTEFDLRPRDPSASAWNQGRNSALIRDRSFLSNKGCSVHPGDLETTRFVMGNEPFVPITRVPVGRFDIRPEK